MAAFFEENDLAEVFLSRLNSRLFLFWPSTQIFIIGSFFSLSVDVHLNFMEVRYTELAANNFQQAWAEFIEGAKLVDIWLVVAEPISWAQLVDINIAALVDNFSVQQAWAELI